MSVPCSVSPRASLLADGEDLDRVETVELSVVEVMVHNRMGRQDCTIREARPGKRARRALAYVPRSRRSIVGISQLRTAVRLSPNDHAYGTYVTFLDPSTAPQLA